MSLIISSGTGRKNAVLTMLLCFSLWKRTDYSLRQHQPLYPEKSADVKAKSEFNMKKFARIRMCGAGEAFPACKHKKQTSVETTKTFDETAFPPLKLLDTL